MLRPALLSFLFLSLLLPTAGGLRALGKTQVLPQAPLNPNSILVSNNNILSEYTVNGTLIQSYPIPYTPGQSSAESSRDVMVDGQGIITSFNGVFSPALSRHNPNDPDQVWTNQFVLGWSLVNNTSYGGVCRFGKYIFVPDDVTFGSPDQTLSGIIRFDSSQPAPFPTERYFPNDAYSQLTTGLDGLLYAVSGDSTIQVINPVSMELLRTILPPFTYDVRGVAVDSDGSLFITDWNTRRAIHLNPAGQPLATLQLPESVSDINLSPSGMITIGSRFGRIFVTDRSFAPPTSFMTLGGQDAFACFTTPVPDISGRVLTATGAPLANAVVELSGISVPSLNRTTRTDVNGIYLFGNVPPAVGFNLTVTASGFRFSPDTFQAPNGITGWLEQKFSGSPDASLPTVTQVYPVSTSPGNMVTVTGTNFVPGTTQVFLGGTRHIPVAIQSIVPTQIQFVVPASSTGAGNLNGYLTIENGPGNSTKSLVLPAAAANPADPLATFPELVLLGDVSGDGVVGTTDSTLVRAFLLSQATPTARQLLAADVVPLNANGSRGNGQLTSTDFTFLRAVLAGQASF